jgi:aryl-alcohol dehydrogenase-like predicted oxidoreductase
MQKRKLGRTNLEVSAIWFGCMGLNFALPPREHRGGRHRADAGRPEVTTRATESKWPVSAIRKESERRTGL